MKKIFALVLTLCLMAGALCITAFAAESDTIVMEVSGLKKDGTIVSLNYWTKFDEGWEKAVDFAEDEDFMEEQGLDRIIVDLKADWNANEDGEFGKSSWDGFRYSTIHVPSDTRITINMNGHKINRGLGDNNEDDGEVIYVDDNADLIINGGKSGDPIVKSSENTEGIPMGTITGGNSDNGAGGIRIMDGARVTLNNVNLIGNAVDDDDGSAIAAYDGAVLVMNGGSVSNNTLWRTFWSYVTPYGAIYLNDATGYFNNVEFADNIFRGYDHAYGVALYVRNSDVTLENCSFFHNGYRNLNLSNKILSPSSIITIDEGTLTFNNCLFENNGTEGLFNGPDVISMFGGTVKINKSIFLNNQSTRAIFCKSGTVEVTETTFEGNTGNVFNGTADEGSFFKNCTFTNNSEEDYWTFSFGEDNKLTFEDCEIDDDATYNDKSRATFITNGRAKAAGSIFGEGSLSMIVAILAFASSAVSIFLTVYYNKKKAVPVAANNATEAEDEE